MAAANIDDAIKEKRATILRLQEEISLLEKAKAVLEGVEPQPMLPLQSGGDSRRHGKGRKGRVRPRSQPAVAAGVLRDAGSALHVDTILERMASKGIRAKKNSLASTLARLARNNTLFFRARDPNTFGLLEWQNVALKQESSPDGRR